jgi:hypothetical protein
MFNARRTLRRGRCAGQLSALGTFKIDHSSESWFGIASSAYCRSVLAALKTDLRRLVAAGETPSMSAHGAPAELALGAKQFVV